MTPRVRLTSNLELSRLAWGMWRITEASDTSPAAIRRIIDANLEAGITTVDQADIYGDYSAESLLGACLKENPGLRDQIELVTKCDIIAPCGRYSDRRVKYYDTSASHISASVECSLRLMNTDHIDLLLLHRPDPLMDPHETAAALDGLITEGKVRAVGVSNFRPHDITLLQSALKAPLATNQIEISLSSHEVFTNGDLSFLQLQGIVPMAWSPLGGGSLADGPRTPLSEKLTEIAARLNTSPPAVAIAWLLAHPAGILPVLGSNRPDRLRALAGSANLAMDRQTWFELYTAARGRDVP